MEDLSHDIGRVGRDPELRRAAAPLTQQGLDAGQVGRILIYFTPAMTTYSFPVAALFAATVVYGRLERRQRADRVPGRRDQPRSVPGHGVSRDWRSGCASRSSSLLFLCFIVPVYTLKVEKVIYSNMAKLIATRVDRSHKIELRGRGGVMRSGRSSPHPTRSILAPAGGARGSLDRHLRPTGQRDPRFMELGFDKHPHMRVIREFWLASSARSTSITDKSRRNTTASSMRGKPAGLATVRIVVSLVGGNKFPRELEGGMQAGIGQTQFGPTADRITHQGRSEVHDGQPP